VRSLAADVCLWANPDACLGRRRRVRFVLRPEAVSPQGDNPGGVDRQVTSPGGVT
jgi:hypothetical protein